MGDFNRPLFGEITNNILKGVIKMKKKTKVIMFILVIAVVALALFFIFQANRKVSENMENRENMNNQTNTTIGNENTNQTVENVENTENTANTLEENTSTPEENESSEEVSGSEESNITDPKTKAIEIVKEDWGEDDSVYFSYDGVNSEGKHIVGVRNKSDTTIRYWYDVDINTGTFTIRK